MITGNLAIIVQGEETTALFAITNDEAGDLGGLTADIAVYDKDEEDPRLEFETEIDVENKSVWTYIGVYETLQLLHALYYDGHADARLSNEQVWPCTKDSFQPVIF